MKHPPQPQTRAPIEITLPSGIFAQIRPLKAIDRLIADADAKAAEKLFASTAGDERAGIPMTAPALVARCVLFDDRKLNIEQVLELDSRDFDAACQALVPYMAGPIR